MITFPDIPKAITQSDSIASIAMGLVEATDCLAWLYGLSGIYYLKISELERILC